MPAPPPPAILNPAQVDVDGPLNNVLPQGNIPFPYSSSEIAVQQPLVMNDLLQDCLAGGTPLAACLLSDRGVYTDRALLTFVLGLTPIYPPGALPRRADNTALINPQPSVVTTAYGQCPAVRDTNGNGFVGNGDTFSTTLDPVGNDQEQKSYSNFAYLMLSHVLTALEGETYTFDSPGSPPGWGPGGTLVANFIQERTGVGPNEVYPANFGSPDPREPAYRQLRLGASTTSTPRGAPSLTVDLGDPRRYRFNVAQSQWESCTSAPEDCASPGATWARIGTNAALNARQVDVAWSYGTGSGMVITVNAMLRFMQGHVVSRGDRSPYAGPLSVPITVPATPPPVASDYASEYAGLCDEEVPAEVRADFGRLAGGHGGQLQGVWAAATRLAAGCPAGSTTPSGTPCPSEGVKGDNIGDRNDLNLPAWDTTDNTLDAWNLFGPSLASGPNNNNVPNAAVTASYVALPCERPDPTAVPFPVTIPVGLSQNVDFVWFLNQWQDPTGTAAAPPAPDNANRYNFRREVVRSGLCQVEQAALDPTEPIPWPTPLGPTFPGELAP